MVLVCICVGYGRVDNTETSLVKLLNTNIDMTLRNKFQSVHSILDVASRIYIGGHSINGSR